MYSSVDDMLVAPSVTKAEIKPMSEDEENARFLADYRKDLDEAITRWWKEADIVTKLDYAQQIDYGKQHLGELGNLALDIPYGLAVYLATEYGWECFNDKDFLRYLQKAVGQQFLASL